MAFELQRRDAVLQLGGQGHRQQPGRHRELGIGTVPALVRTALFEAAYDTQSGDVACSAVRQWSLSGSAFATRRLALARPNWFRTPCLARLSALALPY